MNPFLRFWIAVLSVVTMIASLGFLVMSFVFPSATMFDVGPGIRIGVTFLAALSLGGVVWSTTAKGEVTGPT